MAEDECQKRHKEETMTIIGYKSQSAWQKMSVRRGIRKRPSQEENLQKKDTVTGYTQVDEKCFLKRQNNRRNRQFQENRAIKRMRCNKRLPH